MFFPLEPYSKRMIRAKDEGFLPPFLKPTVYVTDTAIVSVTSAVGEFNFPTECHVLGARVTVFSHFGA